MDVIQVLSRSVSRESVAKAQATWAAKLCEQPSLSNAGTCSSCGRETRYLDRDPSNHENEKLDSRKRLGKHSKRLLSHAGLYVKARRSATDVSDGLTDPNCIPSPRYPYSDNLLEAIIHALADDPEILCSELLDVAEECRTLAAENYKLRQKHGEPDRQKILVEQDTGHEQNNIRSPSDGYTAEPPPIPSDGRHGPYNYSTAAAYSAGSTLAGGEPQSADGKPARFQEMSLRKPKKTKKKTASSADQASDTHPVGKQKATHREGIKYKSGRQPLDRPTAAMKAHMSEIASRREEIKRKSEERKKWADYNRVEHASSYPLSKNDRNTILDKEN